MTEIARFAFRYDRWCGWILGIFASGRRLSRVIVTDSDLEVQLGIAFRAAVPRSSIVSVRRWTGLVFGWGAHGWRGRWLVNGSSKGIVVLHIEPAARGRVLGFPVKLRELAISMETPEALVAALGLQLEPA